MSSVYTYQTLDSCEIRLLHLFAGNDSDDLSGVLETVTLKTADDDGLDGPATPPTYNPPPEYKALSYCWGQHDPTARLWLSNRKSGNMTPYLQIKPNLESALKKLRRDIRPNEQMAIWTDAVCINQADVPERNGQIKKMAEIYSWATEVHIWLGDEGEDSDLAMTFAREIKNPRYFQQALAEERYTEWVALHKLIHRDWFSRRWIVQEISLARTAVVHCGKESMSWDDLEEAVSILAAAQSDIRKHLRGSRRHGHPFDVLGEINGTGALHLVEIASNVARRTPIEDQSVMEHHMSLEGLMSSLTMFETSDPYDIVNALLWLAHDVRPDAALSDVNVARTPMPSPLTETFPGLLNAAVTPPPGEGLRNSQNNAVTSSGRHLHISPRMKFHERKHSVSDVLKKEEQRQNLATEKLVVDYNMSLFECYKKFLEHVFRQSKSLDMICRAWALSPKTQPPAGASPDWRAEEPLPTWMKTLDEYKVFSINPVERVCERVRADPLVGRPGTGPRPYNACGKRKHEGDYAVVHDLGRRLTTRGFALGDIRECGDPAIKGNIPEEWLKTLGWISQPNQQEQPASRPLGTPDRPNWLWRFLVAEKGYDGYQPPPKRFRSLCTWLLDYRTPRTGLSTDFRHGWPPLLRDFVDRVRAVVWERRLITIRHGTSENALLGMAPKEARVGDVVCILFGCSVPVVLRRVKTASLIQTVTAPVITLREAPDQHSDGDPGSKGPGVDTSLPPDTTDHAEKSKSPVRKKARSETWTLDSQTSDETYEFVGECYVYGMMAGEAFKHREDNGIPKRFWNLV